MQPLLLHLIIHLLVVQGSPIKIVPESIPLHIAQISVLPTTVVVVQTIVHLPKCNLEVAVIINKQRPEEPATHRSNSKITLHPIHPHRPSTIRVHLTLHSNNNKIRAQHPTQSQNTRQSIPQSIRHIVPRHLDLVVCITILLTWGKAQVVASSTAVGQAEVLVSFTIAERVEVRLSVQLELNQLDLREVQPIFQVSPHQELKQLLNSSKSKPLIIQQALFISKKIAVMRKKLKQAKNKFLD